MNEINKELMISYATNCSDWEGWQRDYKWGAFYLFPPQPIMGKVNALRHQYDPTSANICNAHISLSDTLSGSLNADALDELQNAISVMAPFEIRYGSLRTYPPHPGVCYDIGPTDHFFKLREIIHNTSLFSESALTRQNIPPHMTIAEFGLTMEQSDHLCDQLKNSVEYGSWLCEGISLAVPNESFQFKEVLYIPLKR